MRLHRSRRIYAVYMECAVSTESTLENLASCGNFLTRDSSRLSDLANQQSIQSALSTKAFIRL